MRKWNRSVAKSPFLVGIVLVAMVALIAVQPADGGELVARIVDADTGKTLAGRVYVEHISAEENSPKWYFVRPSTPTASAIAYKEQWVKMAQSVERHTTVSADSFQVSLPPGNYRITIIRGKEYIPATFDLQLGNDDISRLFRIKRFVDLESLHWFSGETHVHRRISELPNVQLAEDLNVTFPVTYWTINSSKSPDLHPSPLRGQGPSPFGDRQDAGKAMIRIDDTHVMFPRNTEYEIFGIGENRHVLGAVFLLNHKTVFSETMPPVAEIARKAHAEGALLDLDKHNWPWSMMLVPIAKIDLFELANNSIWRTNFGFKSPGSVFPRQWGIQQQPDGLTELGWIQSGLQNYYSLLNCGFKLTPTAGTASGVHPVPLGFGRVYVHLSKGFNADAWLRGLKQGRSFVTTGPILLARVNGTYPGETIRSPVGEKAEVVVKGKVVYHEKVDRVELVGTGFVQLLEVSWKQLESGAWEGSFEYQHDITRSSFVAVRTFQISDSGRVRFAHTAPWHVQIGDERIRPFKWEVDFFIGQMEKQIARNREVLDTAALNEFKEALRIYREIQERAIEQ